jgi:hypothetical protein
MDPEQDQEPEPEPGYRELWDWFDWVSCRPKRGANAPNFRERALWSAPRNLVQVE